MKTKSQIEFHSDGFRPSNPAINVKDRSRYMIIPQLMQRFRCCQATAEKAAQIAWDVHSEEFWQEAQERVDRHLREGRVYSEGRQGGWFVVHGLPSVDSWDAIRVSAWFRLEKEVRAEVEWLTSLEAIADSIEANGWARADALLDDPDAEAEESSHWEARDTVTTL